MNSVNRFNTLCYRFAKYVAEKKAPAKHHQQTTICRGISVAANQFFWPLLQIINT